MTTPVAPPDLQQLLVRSEPAGAIRLLDADPDLGRHLSTGHHALVRRQTIADVRALQRGRWRPASDRAATRALFGLLVLDGALIRRVDIGQRTSVELLGGDLIRPSQQEADEYAVVSYRASWETLSEVKLAILDDELISGLAGVPSVLAELAGRGVLRSRALSVRMAIAQLPSLESRLELLLWHVADRWGRREGDDATVLRLRLTQRLLAELVAAQRTSVNVAVRNPASGGCCARKAQDGGR